MFCQDKIEFEIDVDVYTSLGINFSTSVKAFSFAIFLGLNGSLIGCF